MSTTTTDLRSWIEQSGVKQMRADGHARYASDPSQAQVIQFQLDDGYLVAREKTGVEVSPTFSDRIPMEKQLANAAELLARAVAERIIALDATYGWLVGETGYRSGSDVDGGIDGHLRSVARHRAAAQTSTPTAQSTSTDAEPMVVFPQYSYEADAYRVAVALDDESTYDIREVIDTETGNEIDAVTLGQRLAAERGYRYVNEWMS